MSSPTIAPDGSVTLTVTVTNTGERPCREVVQLYFRDPVAEVTRPLVELTDWALVDLEPGQAREVTLRRAAPSSSPTPAATSRPGSTRARSSCSPGPTPPASSPVTVTVRKDVMIEIHPPPDPHRRRAAASSCRARCTTSASPAAEWGQRLDLLVEAGCDTVASYIPWLFHELPDGTIDVTGETRPERDIGAFIDLAASKGLRFIARPGPFIMAELKNEGIPYRRLPRPPGDRAGRLGRPAGAVAHGRLPRAGLPRRERPLVRRDHAGARRRGCSRRAAR